MRLAILITNTDFSAFAEARPDDGEKFTSLIHEVRPDWVCDPFWVCRDEFPGDIASFDGVLITGSPSSVGENLPWMQRLEALVLESINTGQPLFGACFGHQIIAKVLGARIIRNPEGWGHGLLGLRRVTPQPWSARQDRIALYGSHIEQAAQAPEGAEITYEGPGCPVAGFALNGHVSTIQHHPEMTHAFISDLVEHYADTLGADITERARISLEREADRALFAEEIAAFYEHAAARRSGQSG